MATKDFNNTHVPFPGVLTPLSDTYGGYLTNPQYGLGGIRTVKGVHGPNDSDEQYRDNIPRKRLQEGMVVYISDEDAFVYLRNKGTNLENDVWASLIDSEILRLDSEIAVINEKILLIRSDADSDSDRLTTHIINFDSEIAVIDSELGRLDENIDQVNARIDADSDRHIDLRSDVDSEILRRIVIDDLISEVDSDIHDYISVAEQNLKAAVGRIPLEVGHHYKFDANVRTIDYDAIANELRIGFFDGDSDRADEVRNDIFNLSSAHQGTFGDVLTLRYYTYDGEEQDLTVLGTDVRPIGDPHFTPGMLTDSDASEGYEITFTNISSLSKNGVVSGTFVDSDVHAYELLLENGNHIVRLNTRIPTRVIDIDIIDSDSIFVTTSNQTVELRKIDRALSDAVGGTVGDTLVLDSDGLYKPQSRILLDSDGAVPSANSVSNGQLWFDVTTGQIFTANEGVWIEISTS